MKKIIMSVIALAVISMTIGFVACKKEKENNQISSNSVQDFKLEMQKAGIVHNEGMDYIYKHLTKKNNSPKELMEQVRYYGREFLIQHNYFQNEFDLKKAIEKYDNNNFEIKFSKAGIFEESDSRLSEKQKEVLRGIEKIFDENGFDYSKITNKLEEYENLIVETGTEEEQYIGIVSCEIAKASLSYWYENGKIWEQLLLEDNMKQSGWFNWKEVAGSDIGGAIAGGGIGAAPGAVAGAIGGSVSGSASSAICQLFNHFI